MDNSRLVEGAKWIKAPLQQRGAPRPLLGPRRCRSARAGYLPQVPRRAQFSRDLSGAFRTGRHHARDDGHRFSIGTLRLVALAAESEASKLGWRPRPAAGHQPIHEFMGSEVAGICLLRGAQLASGAVGESRVPARAGRYRPLSASRSS